MFGDTTDHLEKRLSAIMPVNLQTAKNTEIKWSKKVRGRNPLWKWQWWVTPLSQRPRLTVTYVTDQNSRKNMITHRQRTNTINLAHINSIKNIYFPKYIYYWWKIIIFGFICTLNKLVIITDKTGRTIRKNFFLDNMKLDIGQIFRARFYIVRWNKYQPLWLTWPSLEGTRERQEFHEYRFQ